MRFQWSRFRERVFRSVLEVRTHRNGLPFVRFSVVISVGAHRKGDLFTVGLQDGGRDPTWTLHRRWNLRQVPDLVGPEWSHVVSSSGSSESSFEVQITYFGNFS